MSRHNFHRRRRPRRPNPRKAPPQARLANRRRRHAFAPKRPRRRPRHRRRHASRRAHARSIRRGCNPIVGSRRRARKRGARTRKIRWRSSRQKMPRQNYSPHQRRARPPRTSASRAPRRIHRLASPNANFQRSQRPESRRRDFRNRRRSARSLPPRQKIARSSAACQS